MARARRGTPSEASQCFLSQRRKILFHRVTEGLSALYRARRMKELDLDSEEHVQRAQDSSLASQVAVKEERPLSIALRTVARG